MPTLDDDAWWKTTETVVVTLASVTSGDPQITVGDAGQDGHGDDHGQRHARR